MYALLTEHASQEQLDRLNEQLAAPISAGPDELADILARGIALE